LSKQVSVALEDKEKKGLRALLETLPKKDLLDLATTTAEVISKLARGFEGKSIDPQDIITRFTNIKNILERSRFPTYPLLAKQVYLRLIAEYNPNASACKKWADFEAESLISYKGLSREEYVDSIKAAASVGTEQQFYLGDRKPPQPQVKRRFWSRKPKAEESEFENQ